MLFNLYWGVRSIKHETIIVPWLGRGLSCRKKTPIWNVVLLRLYGYTLKGLEKKLPPTQVRHYSLPC